jgi:ribosomal protein S18 acetylase RimI-like enzyme
MIQKIGPSSAGLAAPLFNHYRMFYGQVSDLALAGQYLHDRLSLGESVVFLAFKEEGDEARGLVSESAASQPLTDESAERQPLTGESAASQPLTDESATAALTPIGFAQLYPLLSSICATKNWLLNDLFVDPDYRKLSVGKALLQVVFDFALEQGASTVTLETGVNNVIAQGLYEQLGFVRLQPETEFYTYRKKLG